MDNLLTYLKNPFGYLSNTSMPYEKATQKKLINSNLESPEENYLIPTQEASIKHGKKYYILVMLVILVVMYILYRKYYI